MHRCVLNVWLSCVLNVMGCSECYGVFSLFRAVLHKLPLVEKRSTAKQLYEQFYAQGTVSRVLNKNSSKHLSRI